MSGLAAQQSETQVRPEPATDCPDADCFEARLGGPVQPSWWPHMSIWWS